MKTNDARSSAAAPIAREASGMRKCIGPSGPSWHLRCNRVSTAGSVAGVLPERVTILPDGTAIAQYPEGGGTLYFHDLAHLLAHHELGIGDFDEELG
jgi:hypothetical protein